MVLPDPVVGEAQPGAEEPQDEDREPQAPTWLMAVTVTAAFVLVIALILGFLGVVGHLW
jgi:hypothetical protein